MVWVDIALSMTLPFVAFVMFAMGLSWLVQHTPASGRSIARAQEQGPPQGKTTVVDAAGNVRHEWAIDLEQQRLRRSERRW